VKEVTITGKSVEEALQRALSQLNATQDQVEIDVLEQSKRGFLGLVGSKPAVVKVTKKADSLNEATNFLEKVANQMGVSLSITVKHEEEATIFDIASEKAAILIGKRGQTLNALQYLTNLVANRNSDQFQRVILDAENYRSRRKETLEQLAERLASKALSTRKTVTLEPMSSMDRKVIHLKLQNKSGVTTHSDGSEPHRRIVITPVKK
jgi:spoIIIJ-associated protein